MEIKYLKIKDYLSRLIDKGEDGDVLPSESQLCEYMSASRTTVRRAIEEIENVGLIRRQKGKGAFVNKKSVKSGTLDIFLGIPDKLNVAETPILGILSNLADRDIRLHVFNPRNDSPGTVKHIIEYDIDAIIGIRPNKLDYPIYEDLRKRGYSVLLIDRIIKNSHYNYVSTDFTGDGFQSTEYLINKGHKRILFVGLSKLFHFAEHVHKGYISAHTKNGIAISPELTCRFPDNMRIENVFSEAAEYFAAQFGNFEFSALVVASGGLFMEVVLPVLRANGLTIPKDIEVVVHDKLPDDCPVKPYVHEAIQPNLEVGCRAIEEIEKMRQGEKGKVKVLIPSNFIFKANENIKRKVV